jgi:two-component system sensor histidine kinase DegS
VVSDDGVGFDAALPCGGGLGLVSMRERLGLVGGEIAIDSHPGYGTRIEAVAPVPDRVPPDGVRHSAVLIG